MTQDGVTIAGTKQVNGGLFKYKRTYADGPAYAPVTGYDTIFTAAQAPNYATGVERAENALLSGTGNQLAFRNFIDMITNKPQKGASVQVTINSKAQLAAYQGLQQTLQGKTINGVQQVGGVVALNPSTGAILAMASYPSYDPNAAHRSEHRDRGQPGRQALGREPEPADQQRDPDHPPARLDLQDRHQLGLVHPEDVEEPAAEGLLARSRSSCRTGTSSTTTTTSPAATGPGRRR